MKITPVTQSSGQVGQALGSVDVGRTADPIKMERARQIAQGKQVPEAPADPQVERLQQNVRKIKMRTQQSTHRDDDPVEVVDEAQAVDASTISESVEPPAVEATQQLSPQFAALAKQKRALQLERAEFEKQKTSLPQGNEELVARLKAQPLDVLLEHGVTYDQLTEAILGGQQGNPEIQELKAKIKALEEGVDSKFQSRETAQEEAALTEMLYEAESLAKEGDAFELIRERNAYDQVLRLIHSTYKQSGRVLDVQEAMNTIENQLLSDAEKLAGLSKVRNKFAPPPLQPQQPQRQMRTLTARDSSAAPMSARQRAIAAFQGTLRK